jgi:predicted transcriptional regulator
MPDDSDDTRNRERGRGSVDGDNRAVLRVVPKESRAAFDHPEGRGKTVEAQALRGPMEEKRERRQKWGKALIIIGLVCIFDALAPLPLPRLGAPGILAGFALALLGGALLLESPRMRGTNQALLIAKRHSNCLTVPRLALEMDISLKRAERIINELVRNGVAEIDLDADDRESGITYRIKGI